MENSGNQTASLASQGYAVTGKIMLSAIVILFAAILVILFLHLYVRWHLRRLSRRDHRFLILTAEHQNHPNSRGLAPEVLLSLPVLAYSPSDGDAQECAVCLNEFEEGEKVRALPRCSHAFHIECIDMWFYSHATCPLCRAAVEAEAAVSMEDSVQIEVAEEEEEMGSSGSDLCASCRYEVEMGSSSSLVSSGSEQLRIEVGPRRVEGFRSLEEEMGLKSPGVRIMSLKRLLSRDLRFYCVAGSSSEADLEKGEGKEQAPSPPPPPPPPSSPPPPQWR